MKLLTAELLDKLPPFGTTERDKNAKAIVKFFNPCGAGTWWAFEFNHEERVFFGVAEIHEREMGYFSLDELKDYVGPAGLGIERDLYYEPQTMAEIMGWEEEEEEKSEDLKHDTTTSVPAWFSPNPN